MSEHQVVSREEWLAARKALLEREKAFTRERDALSAERRQLPWVRVEKGYKFQTETGDKSLADLFEGSDQLVVYHFMYGPDWEAGCPSCSFWADGYNGIEEHLRQRNTKLVVVSRAPLDKLRAFRKRMGWQFDWVSSLGSDFNYDFDVSFRKEDLDAGTARYNYAPKSFPSEEAPGFSCFALGDDGAVYHTYSTYGRGLDIVNPAYNILDMTAKGRDEDGFDFPMSWVRLHDLY